MEPVILPLVCWKVWMLQNLIMWSIGIVSVHSSRCLPSHVCSTSCSSITAYSLGFFLDFFFYVLFFSLHLKSAHHDAVVHRQLQFSPLLRLNSCWRLCFYFCFVSFLLFVCWHQRINISFFYVAFEKGCVSVVWTTLGTTNAEDPDFSDRWFSSVL